MAYYANANGYYCVTTSSNTTTGVSAYYTTTNYYGYNTTPKPVEKYKNKEVKHLLKKERGW